MVWKALVFEIVGSVHLSEIYKGILSDIQNFDAII